MTCELLSAVLKAKEEQCGGNWERTCFMWAALYSGNEQQRYSFIINLNQNQQNSQRSHSSSFKDLCVRNNPLKKYKIHLSRSNDSQLVQEMRSIQFYAFAQYSVPILMGTTIIIRKIHNKVSLIPVISQYVCFLMQLHSKRTHAVKCSYLQ